MEPESGNGGVEEYIIQTEGEPTPRTAAELLHTRYDELKAMPLDELQGFEREVVEALRRDGMKARTFAEVSVNFEPRLLKRLKDPNLMHDQLLTNVSHLRRLYQEKQKEAQMQAVLEQRGRFEKKVIERGAERLRTWEEARAITGELAASDERLIAKVGESEQHHRSNGEHFHDFTNAAEPVVAEYMRRLDVFGPGAEIFPSSKFDDIAKKVDFLLKLETGDTENSAPIWLGVDFTVSKDTAVQEKKLRHNFSFPWRSTKYQTQGGLPAKTRFMPVVLSIDAEKAAMMFDDLDKTESFESEYKESGTTFNEHYRADPILMHAVPESIFLQLQSQRHEVETGYLMKDAKRPEALEAYDRALLHIGTLLQQRKGMARAAEQAIADRHSMTYMVNHNTFLDSIRNQLHAEPLPEQPEAPPYQF